MGKKGGKKGGKKKDEGPVEPRFCQLTELRKQLEEESRVQYVVLHLNLMNWSFMDSEIRVRTSSSLFELKAKLAAKHGAMVDLRVCKESFAEEHEMNDDSRSLEDYGFEGAQDGGPEPRYEVYYDFKPVGHNDPLLLVWNTQKEAPAKELPPRETEDDGAKA